MSRRRRRGGSRNRTAGVDAVITVGYARAVEEGSDKGKRGED